MIRRGTKVQLLVFALITLIGVSFVGARYARLDRVFLDQSYTVVAHFADWLDEQIMKAAVEGARTKGRDPDGLSRQRRARSSTKTYIAHAAVLGRWRWRSYGRGLYDRRACPVPKAAQIHDLDAGGLYQPGAVGALARRGREIPVAKPDCGAGGHQPAARMCAVNSSAGTTWTRWSLIRSVGPGAGPVDAPNGRGIGRSCAC